MGVEPTGVTTAPSPGPAQSQAPCSAGTGRRLLAIPHREGALIPELGMPCTCCPQRPRRLPALGLSAVVGVLGVLGPPDSWLPREGNLMERAEPWHPLRVSQ